MGAGIRLERGTDLVLRDAIILRPAGAGLTLTDTPTCTRLGGGMQVEASIFSAGDPDFDDTDCAGVTAYALDPARGNRVVDPLLIEPFGTAAPDFRPRLGSGALTGFVGPPADGFFDLTALHVGAVAGANATGSNVPWYSGWTRGWDPTP
jgi:hypothetical protein